MPVASITRAANTAVRGRRRGRTALAVALGLIGVAAGPAVAAETPAAVRATACAQVTVPAAPGSAYLVAGELCVPAGAKTVQVLVHGFTYGSDFWDPDYGDGRYSYADAAHAAGFATLALDRLGVGASDRPAGAEVTFPAGAEAVHQAVGALRSGGLGAAPFPKVVLVGHSFGAHLAVYEAGTYRDVDALVALGSSHRPNVEVMARDIFGNLVPAASDPKFAGLGLDADYVTTAPGTRGVLHHAPATEPGMLAHEEEAKETGTWPEVFTGSADVVDAASRLVEIPVLTVNGAYDAFFCGGPAADCSSGAALAAFERPYYGPGATVRAVVVPDTGHAALLENRAPVVRTAVHAFLRAYAAPC